jgi:hypothetical protein
MAFPFFFVCFNAETISHALLATLFLAHAHVHAPRRRPPQASVRLCGFYAALALLLEAHAARDAAIDVEAEDGLFELAADFNDANAALEAEVRQRKRSRCKKE